MGKKFNRQGYLPLGIRLAIVVSLFVTVIHTSGAIYFAHVQGKNEAENVQRLMLTTSRLEAKIIEDRMNRLIASTERVAKHVKTIIEYERTPSRDIVNSMLRNSFEKYPDLSGAWVVFEANAFDGQDEKFINAPGHDNTGRFVSWWHTLESDVPKLEPCQDYDQSDYYLIPKRNRRPSLLTPYYYKLMSGRGEWFVSAVAPVIVDGVFHGVVGMDCALRDLRERVGGVRVFGEGFGALISPDGTYAAHPDAKLVGKKIEATSLNVLLSEAQSGGMRKAQHWSNFLKVQVISVCVPIVLDGEEKGWLFRFSLPVTVTQRTSIAQRNAILVANGIILILLVFGISWYLTLKLREVSRIAHRLAEISTGDLDLTTATPLSVAPRGEIRLLANSYNSFLESVRDRFRADSERVRLLDNMVNSFVYRHDLDGVLLYVSSSAEHILGYTLEEMKVHFGQLLSDDSINDHVDSRTEALIRTGKQQVFEVEVICKDGSKRWLNLSESSVVEDAGKIVAVEGIAHDITARKKAEEALQRFALVIEQISEVVVIADLGGNITYVNPAFEQLTGYTQKEVVGRNPRILQSGQTDAAIYRELWDTVTAGRSWAGRFINKKRNGDIFTEDARVLPLLSPDGNPLGYVATKRNVTRELELEAQFLHAQKMEAVGQLAGGVAHDFNNLLSAIFGFGDLAMDEATPGSELHGHLSQMMKAAGRAADLVRQLLAFSRRQILALERTDLSDVVSDFSKMIRRVIGEHITLETHSSTGLKLVSVDRGQFEQVLMNLSINARDAMGTGGTLSIETRNIELDANFCEINIWAQPGQYVLLSITDTGCGMDEETKSRIFEPFFTTKGEGKGTGLGLSTVFGIVRQHGGQIHVESEVGNGSTFHIYLPVLKGDGRPAETTEQQEAPQGGTETILLAEDDEMVRLAAEAILTKAGYTVLAASGGEEALRLFDEYSNEIGLALLDVVMPDIDGKLVAERIRNSKPQLPVLFASGYTAGHIQNSFALNEGTWLLQKPYQSNVLLKRVREFLDLFSR